MLKTFELKKYIRNCKMLDDIWNRVQSWIIILIYQADPRDVLGITTLKAAWFILWGVGGERVGLFFLFFKQLVFHLSSEMLPDPSLSLTLTANMKHTAHYLANMKHAAHYLAFVFTSFCIYETWFHFPCHYLWKFRKHFWYPRFL